MRRSLIIAVAALALLAAGVGGVVIATTGSAADHEPLGPITVRAPEQPSSPDDASAPAAPIRTPHPPAASKLAPPPPPVDVPAPPPAVSPDDDDDDDDWDDDDWDDDD